MSVWRSPKLVDVAREAGVSKSAASRALLGQGDVSPDTVRRVQEAADALGYVPNAMARALAARRTNSLGVVLRDVTNPFYGHLYASIQARAAELGYTAVAMSGVGELTLSDAQNAFRSLLSLRVDALIVSSAQLAGQDLVRYADRLPIVVAGPSEASEDVAAVYCDDHDGGSQLAHFVAGLGHKNVAVLLVAAERSATQHLRGKAMISVLKSRGVSVRVIEIDSYQRPARSATVAALADPEITAVMCPHDFAAIEVLEELRVRGVQVPGQISVTGYDAIGYLAAPYLGLTSFRQPIEEIGALSADRAIAWAQGNRPEERSTRIKGTIVPGRSTAPPRLV